MIETNLLIKAIEYAAQKHMFQRRKGYLKIPYINHPIKVCKLLTDCGEIDIDLLLAAILHDTLEDTDATFEELIDIFGGNVAQIVMEVTDDMSLPEKVRKQKQIDKADMLSDNAKKIKIADKICNIKDILTYPISWSRKKKLRYVEWSALVVCKCKGSNMLLNNAFDDIYDEAKAAFYK
jgi:guanosine-3',5'-bis(diphosphate) 3'-pyrophosphohydrolase